MCACMQTYFDKGLLNQSNTIATKAKKAIEVKEAPSSSPSLFEYSISAKNPLIILPHTVTPHFSPSVHHSYNDIKNADSEYLVLDLGNITIANKYFLSKAQQVNHERLISISISRKKSYNDKF